MIARMWRGRTRAADAEAYHELLARTGVKDCAATPGNMGVQVFRRVEGGEAEFVFVSLWDSYDAIDRFAGPDREKAVYYPEDRNYLLALDPAVVHYEVLG